MSEQEKLERGKRRTKRLMITITVAFLVLMLVIPLASVIASSLKEGIGFYLVDFNGICAKRTWRNDSGNGDRSHRKYVFWNLRHMAFDKIFLSRETDPGDAH